MTLPMIADTPQRAIFDESPRYHRFMEYRVAGEPERGRIARAVGSALGAFQSFHRREPTAAEHVEIVEIIESRAGAIREFFSGLNP